MLKDLILRTQCKLTLDDKDVLSEHIVEQFSKNPLCKVYVDLNTHGITDVYQPKWLRVPYNKALCLIDWLLDNEFYLVYHFSYEGKELYGISIYLSKEYVPQS